MLKASNKSHDDDDDNNNSDNNSNSSNNNNTATHRCTWEAHKRVMRLRVQDWARGQ